MGHHWPGAGHLVDSPGRDRDKLQQTSKIETHTELDLTRIISLRSDDSKSLRALQVDGWIEKVHMVESVEEFRGKGQRGSFRNRGLLGNTQIQVPKFQSPERATARGGIHAQLRRPKLVEDSLRIAEYVQTRA